MDPILAEKGRSFKTFYMFTIDTIVASGFYKNKCIYKYAPVLGGMQLFVLPKKINKNRPREETKGKGQREWRKILFSISVGAFIYDTMMWIGLRRYIEHLVAYKMRPDHIVGGRGRQRMHAPIQMACAIHRQLDTGQSP